MTAPSAPDPAALRRAAEARLHGRAATRPPATEADLRRLAHELEVHQIELEMQNEELRAAQAETQAALERYTDLFDFAPVGYLTLDPPGTILSANLTVARLLGVERASLSRRRLALLIDVAHRDAFQLFLDAVFTNGGHWASCELLVTPVAVPPLFVRVEAVASPGGQDCRAVLLDISARHRAETERDRSIADLQHALARVKQLSGLLPICASCKKIRDDGGYWNKVETYIAKHSEATFTHGICPTCAEKFLQDLDARLPVKKPSAPTGL